MYVVQNPVAELADELVQTAEYTSSEFEIVDIMSDVDFNNNGIDDNSGDKDIVNPQTSDESLWVFTAGGFSMIGLAATAYFINKERNN